MSGEVSESGASRSSDHQGGEDPAATYDRVTYGSADLAAEVPAELLAAVRALADRMQIPAAAVLLAGQVKVLSLFAGAPEVAVNFPAADGTLQSVAVTVPVGSWGDLIRATAAAVADGSWPQAGTTVVASGVPGDDQLADRMRGYRLAALRAMTAAPDQDHDELSLLSEQESHQQVYGHDANCRPLPDVRAHELVSQQALLRPEAVAVRHRGQSWTYGELDRQADRIARMLSDHGLRPEDVVAVEAERTFPWVAAILGVLRAGGVYLPLDPAYPADRTAMLLRQSRAVFVVSARPVVEAALEGTEGVVVLPLDPDAGPEAGSETESGSGSESAAGGQRVAVGESQLAYIYFTSGSTGAPKGAMCEHLGLLNHLIAKVEVLDLGPGDVVLQNAPVGFDISLWQALAVLTVGGTVELVADEEILDVRGFIGRVVDSGATVLQLVPSYLDIVLGELEARPRALGRLRRVSVTGEAISARLVSRWLALYPQIALVNAYGATEASDDTMHAVLSAPPVDGPVTVGRPIQNVTVYVLDDRMRLVPLGAPGEVYFSGLCVGRGYANDPERTAQAFLEDPFRPGRRLYRTGDFGRWLPSGELEFLGRRDEQVKIRGMRVEIGEVEQRILGVEGVTAVGVVAAASGYSKRLVAFYCAGADLPPARLLAALRRTVPEQLVPAACHQVDALPLTENGKTDKKKLTAWAAEHGRGSGGAPPATPSERRLATVWAEVLGLPLDERRADDDFFALGGDSLAAIRMVVKLDRAVSLTDLMRHPVLRDLAALLDGAERQDPALLQRLAGFEDCDAALVCFPDAAGNALNFGPLAQALAPRGIAVWAVEPPGHDVADTRGLWSTDRLAEQIAAELERLSDTRILLWGHGAGLAPALETARLLERDGRPAERVFAAARRLGSRDELLRAADAVARLTDDAVRSELAAQADFVEVDEFQAERRAVVGEAYRHDTAADARYLAAALDRAQPIRVPLTVVTADEDPQTPDGRPGEAERWDTLAADVSYAALPVEGRRFHRTRPQDVAELVSRAVRSAAESEVLVVVDG